jgi:hypothetical protein
MAAAPDFNTLHTNINGAEAEHEAALKARDAAQARYGAALESLNTTQKAFDDAVSSFRASVTPPAGSYWATAPKPAA